MRYTAEITQTDIDEATIQRDARTKFISQICPVTRACRRIFGDRVTSTWRKGLVLDYEAHSVFPEQVSTFIGQFDLNKPVDPMSFEFELPDAVALSPSNKEAN